MPELRQSNAVLTINSQVGASRSPHVRVQGIRRCVDGSRQQPRRAGGGLDMRVDTICTDQLALCPTCGEPMRFAPAFSKFGAENAQQIFECKLCRLAVTTEEILDEVG